MTAVQLADATDKDDYTVRRALKLMPDAYIASWVRIKRSTNHTWAAVWKVVLPPPDCPRPRSSE